MGRNNNNHNGSRASNEQTKPAPPEAKAEGAEQSTEDQKAEPVKDQGDAIAAATAPSAEDLDAVAADPSLAPGIQIGVIGNSSELRTALLAFRALRTFQLEDRKVEKDEIVEMTYSDAALLNDRTPYAIFPVSELETMEEWKREAIYELAAHADAKNKQKSPAEQVFGPIHTAKNPRKLSGVTHWYLVKSAIRKDGRNYGPGEAIKLDEVEIPQLLEAGAVELLRKEE